MIFLALSKKHPYVQSVLPPPPCQETHALPFVGG
jgi:hypothetical protein